MCQVTYQTECLAVTKESVLVLIRYHLNLVNISIYLNCFQFFMYTHWKDILSDNNFALAVITGI